MKEHDPNEPFGKRAEKLNQEMQDVVKKAAETAREAAKRGKEVFEQHQERRKPAPPPKPEPVQQLKSEPRATKKTKRFGYLWALMLPVRALIYGVPIVVALMIVREFVHLIPSLVFDIANRARDTSRELARNENGDTNVLIEDGEPGLAEWQTPPSATTATQLEGSTTPLQSASEQVAKASTTPRSATASAASPYGKTYALLVGVGEYDRLDDLPNPVLDVDAVGRELKEAYGAQTTILRNPTREMFLTTLYSLADRAYAKNDQVLVFFAGHGWFDDRLRRGFIALRDSSPLNADPLRDTLVSHEDVRTMLERLDCDHVLLVMDACFSGTVDPMVAMAPATRALMASEGLISQREYIERKLSYKTRRYITAGGKEYVPDGRPGHHSPFTRQFLEALRSYGGQDGVLTLEEVQLHLERVTPQPRAGELLGNEPGSSFVLVARSQEEKPSSAIQRGSLKVVVAPSDATPTLEWIGDGETTRYRSMGGNGSGEYRFNVPVGSYRVRVTAADGRSASKDVTVSAGEQTVQITIE